MAERWAYPEQQTMQRHTGCQFKPVTAQQTSPAPAETAGKKPAAPARPPQPDDVESAQG